MCVVEKQTLILDTVNHILINNLYHYISVPIKAIIN